MSSRTEFRFQGRDGKELVGYRWEPDGAPRAVVQMSHGVGEHLLRYERLAQALTAAGFFVHGHDSRGHGKTLTSGGGEPGVIGADGWAGTVDDLDVVVDRGHAEFPGLPLVLFAHSMGSFAAQQYLLDHSHKVDAVALSGTSAVDLIEPALDLDAGVGLEAFNAPFEHRTGFEWLSRDEHEVDLYVADPLCGFAYDIEGMKAVFAGARQAADPARLAAIRRDLPVYIAVGDQDPVNGQLALVHALVERYRAAGLTDVELHNYAGARHEILNETNREEVEADLLTWLNRNVPRTA